MASNANEGEGQARAEDAHVQALEGGDVLDDAAEQVAPAVGQEPRRGQGNEGPEERHPVSRILFAIYEPACRLVLRFPKATIALALAIVLSTVPVYQKLGHEFMPALNEGTILYMPTTLPGISVTEASRLLQLQDRILKSFPEVVTVFGKAGRAESSTDPAPFSMMETTVMLMPPSEWRHRPRWYSSRAPEWLRHAR